MNYLFIPNLQTTIHDFCPTHTISYLRMHWRLKEPMHQQTWYGTPKPEYSVSTIRRVKSQLTIEMAWYRAVTTMQSQSKLSIGIRPWRLTSPIPRMFVKRIVQIIGPSRRESKGNPWIPLTNGQLCMKRSHAMIWERFMHNWTFVVCGIHAYCQSY